MKPIAVIGAGISGLAAAYRVQKHGLPVVVYEKQNRTGGVIRSGHELGFLTESGPISLRPTPLLDQIVHELNLDAQRVPANETVKKRFLVREGKLVPMPGSPASAIISPFLSWPAKIRLLGEPFIPRSTSQDPTLAEFVSRRLGSEVLEHAVEPLVSGMYAGEPERLSVRYAFPKLYQLEQSSGSLLRGVVVRAIRRPRRQKNSLPFSFSDGVEVLTQALSSSLNGSLRTRAGVVQIIQNGSDWTVIDESGSRAEYAAVIVTAAAPQVAQIEVRSRVAVDLSPLQRVAYSGVVRIVFGFRRSQMTRAIEGFGFLAPRCEHLHLLGSVFFSSIYPHSAPADCVSFLCFLGGARRPDVLRMDNDVLLGCTLGELRQLIGGRGTPVYSSVLRIPQAIPQYDIGHGEVCAALDRAESVARGLILAGNYRDGIAAPDALASGWNAAGRAVRVWLG